MPETDDGGLTPSFRVQPNPCNLTRLTYMYGGENLQIFMTQIIIEDEGKNHISSVLIPSEGASTIESIILAHIQTW